MAEEETKTVTENNQTDSNVNIITIKKDDLWRYSTFVLGALLVLGLFVFVLGGNGGTTGNIITGGAVAGNNAPTPSVQPPAVVDVSEDDDPFLGDANAPVTIIEFSDYQCPFCGRFWSQTLPSIKSQYIDTGKVKLVFRDFPLDSIHPFATPAAIAAECVREQGGDEAYFEYHDILFTNQAALSQAGLISWAKQEGYNIESCLNSGKFRSEVQNDFRDGGAAGVSGTPAFFVNGKLISGAQPFSVFQQAIEAEL
jgi:protein-disulfide isomerase